jgi:O-antigen/teichoic acid export membrane protein
MLYGSSVRYLLLALFPIILVVVTLAQDGLKLWLGAEFAEHGFRVLQWLAVGVFINGLAAAPFAVVQGAGRPDLTAKLHLVELPVYLMTMYWLTNVRGIEGAAIAWTGRVTFDAIVLFILARQFVPIRSSTQLQTLLLIAGALGTFGLATLLHSWEMKRLFLILTFLGFVLVGWFMLLSPEDEGVRLTVEG